MRGGSLGRGEGGGAESSAVGDVAMAVDICVFGGVFLDGERFGVGLRRWWI